MGNKYTEEEKIRLVLRDVFIINGTAKIMRLSKIKFLIIHKRPPELNQEAYSFYITDVCLMISLIFTFLSCDLERVAASAVAIADMAASPLRRSI